MKILNRQALLLTVCLSGLTMLAGCGQDTESPAPAAPTGQAEVAAPANTNPLEPRYSATLAEGVDFAKPGYPEFITEVSGISVAEAWGRWTDASLGAEAKLRFKDPLPQQFTLKLKVRDFFGLNVQDKVAVRVGGKQQDFVLQGGQDQTAELVFDGLQGADTIEISVPRSSKPTAADSRKMGLGLISLSIHE